MFGEGIFCTNLNQAVLSTQRSTDRMCMRSEQKRMARPGKPPELAIKILRAPLWASLSFHKVKEG